jgi:hypothetical protein
MGDVILAEVLSVVGCLEPKLAEGFPLRVWSNNTIHTNEAS